jgi:hypothetical protein
VRESPIAPRRARAAGTGPGLAGRRIFVTLFGVADTARMHQQCGVPTFCSYTHKTGPGRCDELLTDASYGLR